jgi:DNA-binding Lrp family transcriptional regulator
MRKRDIDQKDLDILNILQENAFISNKDLAIKIGLSEGATLVRVQNLFAKGVILRYAAIPNLPYLGYTEQLLVKVRVLKEKTIVFRERVLNNRKITSCVLVQRTGDLDYATQDYIIRIIGKNESDCRDTLGDLFGDQPIAAYSEVHYVKEIIKMGDMRFEASDIR